MAILTRHAQAVEASGFPGARAVATAKNSNRFGDVDSPHGGAALRSGGSTAAAVNSHVKKAKSSTRSSSFETKGPTWVAATKLQSDLLVEVDDMSFHLHKLCKIIEGQRYVKALSSNQRAKQIAACKQAPQDRLGICERAMSVSKYSTNRVIAEFGLVFKNKLAGVQGRMLPAPKLESGDGRREEPREGRWNFNNKKLKQGVQIDPWAVAVFDPRCHDADRVA